MKNKKFSTKGLLLAAIIATGFSLSSCSTADKPTVYAGDIEISDPFEGTNRAIFSFNEAVDDAVIHPVIKGYREVVPSPAREGVHNFLTNLGAPIDLANQLLQGDIDGAGSVLLRTTINTLVGVGGLFDVAGNEGIEHEGEDFGQTLATWGVGHGPYVVLPILGPSSTRDYAGYLVDAFADPVRMHLDNVDKMHIYYQKSAVNYIDMRDSLMDVLSELEKSSIDYYASVRSSYYQNREAMVNDKKTGDIENIDIPDYDDY